MPVSNTVMLLMIIKICGRISMSRLHKIVYILKLKYGVPLSLSYERPLSIYSDSLENDVGVLVTFGFLDVQIISSGDYVDRVYRITYKGDRVLRDILQDSEAEKLFNKLKSCVRDMESLPVGELVAEAKKFIHKL